MTTLNDLINLPSAIERELEERSQMRANALAHKLVNKVTGSNIQMNPYSFNPYHESNSQNSGLRLTQHVSETQRRKK